MKRNRQIDPLQTKTNFRRGPKKTNRLQTLETDRQLTDKTSSLTSLKDEKTNGINLEKKDFKTSADFQTKTSYCGSDTDMNTDKLYTVGMTRKALIKTLILTFHRTYKISD